MWTLIYIIVILQKAKIFVAGGCGGYYTSMTGSFTTENYPLDYPDNSNCTYTIMVPEGYSIILTFIHFYIEAGYDFVLVKEKTATLFSHDGEQKNIPPINSSGNSLYVYFTSDGSVTHSGFSATYYTKRVGGCGGYYTSMTGSFTTENYPLDYPDNSNCTYTILVPEGYSIILTFIHFYIEAGYDFVLVKEKTATLFSHDGEQKNIPPINSSGNSLYVYFTSDGSVTHSGFSATYYTKRVGGCGGYYTSMTGSFTTENYPLDYPDNSNCTYTIMVPEGYSIILTFIHFYIEAGYDFVLVKEKTATLFSHDGEQKNIPPINSSGNSLYVYFTSDGSVTHSGFSATYYTKRVGGCGGYYTSMTGSFTSENYPSDYPHNSRCRYTIMVPDGYSITLTFTDFHLEDRYDFVKVKENVATLFSDSGEQKHIPPINSSGNSLYVYFTSDGDTAYSGFSATYYTKRVVNGGWSSWLNWNRCTASCGGGISTRSRDCINPAPSNGGTCCFGDSVESRVCNTNCCPVNGNWSTWSIWDNCDVTCGFGIQQRTRTCDNPYPVFDGFNCTGKDLQIQNCSTSPCPVNGGWSSWLNWNSCTVSCGGGISKRSRDCINPAPSNGGTCCFGDSVESRVCNTNYCPVNGNWRTWSIWDNCDVTCGFGIQQRTRTCDNQYPVFCGFNCTGKDLQTRNCSTSPCPILIDSHKQLYTLKVVGGVAIACIICTSVLCLTVHLTIRRLRQNKGREETSVDINERDENYEELRLRRATPIYDNAEYIRPDNPQDDVRGNTERPESNVYANLKY